MLYRLYFKKLSLAKKEKAIMEKGNPLGSRYTGKRTVFLYMIKNFFVEVAYNNDQKSEGIEDVLVFSNHEQLNKYLVS